MDTRDVLEELLARQLGRFDLSKVCFKEQVDFINDKAKLKTVVAGRRGGKTTSAARYLYQTALHTPKATVLYGAITKDYAKSLIWSELVALNAELGLGARIVESELLLQLPNQSNIKIFGADNASEVRKARGFGIALAIIDEAQSFRNHILEDLIENVISKTLYDYDGTLVLMGTPGPVPSGYFFNCAAGKMSSSYSHHKWTMFENPFIKKKSGKEPIELLEQDLKRKGVTIDDPGIRREVFAEWVTDSNALVFRYDSNRNHYTQLPLLTDFVIGVDIGYDDADAIAVLGWSAHEPIVYLVEENVKSGQTVTELALVIQQLVTKYQPLKIVMDTGGLGKKLAEELRKRFSLPVHAAEKARKFEFIELLNDALRSGRFMAMSESNFARDSYLVEWDRSNPQKLQVKSNFHSDICDAVLYAYRESLHWLFMPPAPVVTNQTPEWFARIEREMEEEAAQRALSSVGEDDSQPWGKGIKPTDWE